MTRPAQLIADRLVLRPTRHVVEASGKTRRKISFRRGHIEAWTQRVGTHDLDEVDLFVLKFPGRAGRAERATYHPVDYWSDLRAELWSINPPGYGGSTGVASLRTLADAGRAAYLDMAALANGRPIVLMGNSLGTVTAMYLAARFEVAGMVLRNPPPLRELIVGQHGWWNLWLGAWLIALNVPQQICSIRNARDCRCPAVFLCSRKDEVVPAVYQDRVIQAYGGPYRLLNLQEADHAGSLNLEEQREYQRHLQWLRELAIPFRPQEAAAPLVPELLAQGKDVRRVDPGTSPPSSARPVNGTPVNGYSRPLPISRKYGDAVSDQIGSWG